MLLTSICVFKWEPDQMYTYKRLLTQCAIKALGLACVFGPNLAQAQVAVDAGVSINGEAMWKIGNILEYIGLRQK